MLGVTSHCSMLMLLHSSRGMLRGAARQDCPGTVRHFCLETGLQFSRDLVVHCFLGTLWQSCLGTSSHRWLSMVWHSCLWTCLGTLRQVCSGTMRHLFLGTFWQFSLGTWEQIWRGMLWHCWRGTFWHCCLGTLLHCCLGTLLHSCLGTCLQAGWAAACSPTVSYLVSQTCSCTV